MRPPIIEQFWYAIDWDVPAIWALDLPVVSVPMAELVWHLDVPVWPDESGRPYTVTPLQVIEQKELYPTEYARIQRADLSFAIDIIRLEDRLMILDGIHRLAKSHLAGHKKICARMVPHSAVHPII